MVINNMKTSISTHKYVNIQQTYVLYIIFGDEIYLLVDLYDIQNNQERKCLDITKNAMILSNMESKLNHYNGPNNLYYLWLRERVLR